jgi:hypothetical protein
MLWEKVFDRRRGEFGGGVRDYGRSPYLAARLMDRLKP